MSYNKIELDSYLKSELDLLPKLQEYFNKDIQHIKTKYSPYDYKDDNTYYELKTRNNCLNEYPTTMIGYDKINKDKETIFLFKYIDGLYYIKYNKDNFKDYNLKLFRRTDRGCKEKLKYYIYIPIEDLIKID
jgi:hypothetical protein